MTTCQKCGARVDADDEFCPECGAKIRAQPTEALPARQAMLIAVQPKKHWFLKTVLIFIIIIFLARACANFASEPQIPPKTYQPEYIQEVPAESERLISIDTPPPRVSPIPEPEPLPAKATSGVSCTDSDGKDYYTAGYILTDDPLSSGYINDQCLLQRAGNNYKETITNCLSSDGSCYVEEVYCKDIEGYGYETASCPNGCIKGGLFGKFWHSININNTNRGSCRTNAFLWL